MSGGDIAELTGCLLATAGLALLLHRRRQNTPVG
jgi:hypothetical protein